MSVPILKGVSKTCPCGAKFYCLPSRMSKSRCSKPCVHKYAKRWEELDHVLPPKEIRQAYASQKCAARRRRIPFLLSIKQWLQIWEASKVFHLRGKTNEQYCMARHGDRGAYEVGNVSIVTNVENHTQQEIRRGWHHTEEVKAAASKRLLGKPLSLETRARMSKAQAGKTLSAAHRANIAKASLGRRLSAATKEKMRRDRESKCAPL